MNMGYSKSKSKQVEYEDLRQNSIKFLLKILNLPIKIFHLILVGRDLGCKKREDKNKMDERTLTYWSHKTLFHE